jgi:hypothetical protein
VPVVVLGVTWLAALCGTTAAVLDALGDCGSP